MVNQTLVTPAMPIPTGGRQRQNVMFVHAYETPLKLGTPLCFRPTVLGPVEVRQPLTWAPRDESCECHCVGRESQRRRARGVKPAHCDGIVAGVAVSPQG